MRPLLLLICSFLMLGACSNPSKVADPVQLPIQKMHLFSPVSKHTHGSTVVELPNGDLLAAWFQGSGERWADDVAILGARLLQGSDVWSTPFVMADVQGFPDINPALFLDGQGRLWLSWYTVLANLWETSLPKYRISEDYMMAEGPPLWQWQEVLHVKPGGSTERGIQPDDAFVASVKEKMDAYERYLQDSLQGSPEILAGWQAWRTQKFNLARGADQQYGGYLYDDEGERTKQPMGFPLFRRIGWQTKNKALVLADNRMILPLYSDGLGFSLMALTDDGGKTWQYSEPLIGFENIQASLVPKRNGELVAYMRDNGPPPQRLQMSTSHDKGLSWSPVKDSQLPNPGSGADLVHLQNGHWVLAYNDTEDGRHSLALSISEDEGKTWPYTRRLEYEDPEAGTTLRASYPAIISGQNGYIHVVYSYSSIEKDGVKRECIKYARLSEDWIRDTP